LNLEIMHEARLRELKKLNEVEFLERKIERRRLFAEIMEDEYNATGNEKALKTAQFINWTVIPRLQKRICEIRNQNERGLYNDYIKNQRDLARF